LSEAVVKEFPFVNTALAGAVFVLMPLVVVSLLIGKAWEALRKLSGTVVDRLPATGLDHLPLAMLLTIASLVLLCYLLGRVVAPTRDINEGTWLERKVLQRIPGYQILRGMALAFLGLEGAKSIKVALLRREDRVAELVIVIEAVDDHRSVIFVPESPAPMTGTVLVVDNELLEVLPIGAGRALQAFTRWGGGVADLVPKGAIRG
jgi:uncharacterized membrane protein